MPSKPALAAAKRERAIESRRCFGESDIEYLSRRLLLDSMDSDSSPCRVYTGHVDRWGYGKIKHLGKTMTVHSAAYLASGASIPDGFNVHHICGVRHCVNPKHLVAVSPKDHAKFHPMAHPTHCKRGHEMNDSNTHRISSRGKDERRCKICGNDAARRFRKKSKSQTPPDSERI